MKGHFSKYKNIYFLGIGGAGMSGLAGWFHAKNYHVGGYDKNSNNYTKKLKLKGIKVQHNGIVEEVKGEFLDKKNTLIVYTPAVKINHLLFLYFVEHNFHIIKRSQLLSQVCCKYNVIAIAGTHGKTTISIMLTHILLTAGYNPNAFFGGVYINQDTNFIVGGEGCNDYMVVEADEYDCSFLDLNPVISLITSLDKDHIDTYASETDMLDAYYQFMLNTFQSKETTSTSFQFEKNKVYMPASVKKKFIKYLSKKTDFNILLGQKFLDELSEINMNNNLSHSICEYFCEHNIQNAILASKIASILGVSKLNIERGLESFKGVKRRFQYHENSKKLILIDDYAHHPKELEVLINSVRKLYKTRKLFLFFQPHLFSRTKDLEQGFIDVLSLVDELALLDIYPAREKPINGVSSRNLLKKINLQHKFYVDYNTIEKLLIKKKPNLIITAGAGDIFKIIPIVKKVLL